MSFTAPPLLPGDTFDLAQRFALALDQELSGIEPAPARAACLARHWREIQTLGWTATLLPEEEGGAGAALAELAALAEGAGRAALALPVAAACAVAPGLLLAAGEAAHSARIALATGEVDICPVLPPLDAVATALRLRAADGSLRLDGSLAGVTATPAPTHFLIACGDEADDAVLLLLPAGAPGIGLASHLGIDGRPSLDLDFSGVSVPPEAVLARGATVRVAVAQARDLGALLTCVEAVSAMGALIEQTIAYLSTRSQFGTTLSTFQALRHRVAEMFVAYANLRALVAPLLGEALPDWRDIAFAKLRLGEAGRFVAQSAIQLHGGMGMTEELPATRLARRILMAEFEYGDRNWHAARLLAARKAEEVTADA
jgi:alkylation response protein AidB-like acyl-CoA dehydrogenase